MDREFDDLTNEESLQDETEQTPTDEEAVESEDTSEDSEETVDADEDTTEADDGEDESSEDESDDSDDDWLDWDTLKKEHELPDGLDSFEDVLTAYKESLREMKRGQTEAQKLKQLDDALKARGVDGGVEALLSGQIPEPKSRDGEGGSYFGENPWTKQVNELIEGGLIREEDRAAYKSLAQVGDKVMAPILDQMEDVWTVTMSNLQKTMRQVDDIAWQNFSHKHKDKVSRDDLNRARKKFNVGSYDEAMKFYLLSEKPDLLDAITRDAEQKGFKKGHKKLKRGRSMPKSKGQKPQAGKWDTKKYLNPDGSVNTQKLERLSLDNQLEVLNQLEKEHKPR